MTFKNGELSYSNNDWIAEVTDPDAEGKQRGGWKEVRIKIDREKFKAAVLEMLKMHIDSIVAGIAAEIGKYKK